ncbi:peptidoglycan-binding protein [Actinomadura sp. NBRC 104425]|uniref:efflux RND transporter periplasmic adaptor subunit n=1 Tax=Actinomadura sp. NBRC 104425 TaxID=3032204 RepID=UPI0024A09340|nr:peptidoglycan-binding protein [Actinomadura sp. NBRC 104425]GLZ14911.1 peptidoglycan-binding protein [Actinomadura sp. NBRC 104425]
MLDSELDNPLTDKKTVPPPRPRRRRGRALLGGTAVLAIGAAGAAYALNDGGGSKTPATSALPTATVVRTNLTTTANVDGTLGYAGEHTVLADGGKRITWLPREGAVIRRGEQVYGVDGRRVPLFYGKMPFWRTLHSGVSNGYDVLVLERNLKALGFGDGMTVDRDFTYATQQAIEEWQDDIGVPQTGVVKVGDVVVQPDAIRVTKVKAVLGARASGTVLTASGTRREVTVNLPVGQQGMAVKGAKVDVTLPGGKKATGRITSVGTVATAGSTGSSTQTGQSTETATIPVFITLDKSGSVGNLDNAPVTVAFASAERRNVLAVPITALLASGDGDYSVNVVDASGAVRSVPVRLGIFDDDMVEVSGALSPGMKVQVPKS